MDVSLKNRLASVQSSSAVAVDPEIKVNKVVLHNAKGDELPLRTKPEIVGVFVAVRRLPFSCEIPSR